MPLHFSSVSDAVSVEFRNRLTDRSVGDLSSLAKVRQGMYPDGHVSGLVIVRRCPASGAMAKSSLAVSSGARETTTIRVDRHCAAQWGAAKATEQPQLTSLAHGIPGGMVHEDPTGISEQQRAADAATGFHPGCCRPPCATWRYLGQTRDTQGFEEVPFVQRLGLAFAHLAQKILFECDL